MCVFSPLVYRIRSILHSFIPLLERFRLTGNSDLVTNCMYISLNLPRYLILATFSKLQFPVFVIKKEYFNYSPLQLLGFRNYY